MNGLKNKLFGNLDFSSLIDKSDFKEDSVREVIILPILKELGYDNDSIHRSVTLQHPYLKIGSKKRPINLIPDYILKIGGNVAWVLDAKSPIQKIDNNDNIAQVFSYASHFEIRSNFFCLCNGIEFSVYRTSDPSTPILFFEISRIEEFWSELYSLLSANSFHIGKEITYDNIPTFTNQRDKFDYSTRPLLNEIPVRKQATKRHYGVHGYFTKQSWNVVSAYVENFSQPGDLVLDPYGGSGVTAIEALMKGRKAINIDLNPLAIFLVQSLVAPVNSYDLNNAYQEIKSEYERKEPKTSKDIKNIVSKLPGPKPLKLPKGSDVKTADKLFSKEQIAKLSLLKSIILKQKDKNLRKTFLLMFSGLVTKANLTYHTSTYVAKEGGGDASAFRYYRYRIAPKPVAIDIMKFFELRFKKIKAAKKEIEYFINHNTIDNIQVIKGTATDLSFLKNETVDYIYTDPPYGKKIPYLDLSTMWNAWLDLDVTDDDFDLEAIEGGDRKKSKEDYNALIAKSIQEMYRVLKFDRWLSFVFAHKDPEFWHLIINTAEKCGFEYRGAVPQKNGQTSFKKRQNPFTVLSGQLIINFRKVKNPRTILKANLGMNIGDIVINTIEALIAKNQGATLEQINDELIIKGLELGFLDLLKKEYSDLTPLLLENYDYDEATEKFKLKKNTQFKTHIDIKLRIRYYLISYLRRMEREGIEPNFDDIVLAIMPLLRNGLTPEEQTILNVLEDIADRVGNDKWRIKADDLTLF